MTEEDSEERGKTEINKTGIPNEKAKSHESGAEKENNQPRKPRLHCKYIQPHYYSSTS